MQFECQSFDIAGIPAFSQSTEKTLSLSHSVKPTLPLDAREFFSGFGNIFSQAVCSKFDHTESGLCKTLIGPIDVF
jgi:hypothetical protein